MGATPCLNCKGSGWMINADISSDFHGTFIFKNQAGQIFRRPCNTCRGMGFIDWKEYSGNADPVLQQKILDLQRIIRTLDTEISNLKKIPKQKRYKYSSEEEDIILSNDSETAFQILKDRKDLPDRSRNSIMKKKDDLKHRGRTSSNGN